jgi:hypothetical protein
MGSVARKSGRGARGFGEWATSPKNRGFRTPSLVRILDSSWSVPPQCEYVNETALRRDFSSVKSGLNVDWVGFRLIVS